MRRVPLKACGPKVYQSEPFRAILLAMNVRKYVFRFQIAVDDSCALEYYQSVKDLAEVRLDSAYRKTPEPMSAYNTVKGATEQLIHNAEMFVVHKVVQNAQCVTFPRGVIVCVDCREYGRLHEALAQIGRAVLEHFDSHKGTTFLVFAQQNLAKGAASQHLHHTVAAVGEP